SRTSVTVTTRCEMTTTSIPSMHPPPHHRAHRAFAARPRPLRTASDRSQPYLRPPLTKSNQPPTSAVRGWPHYYYSTTTDCIARAGATGDAPVSRTRKSSRLRLVRVVRTSEPRRLQTHSLGRKQVHPELVRHTKGQIDDHYLHHPDDHTENPDVRRPTAIGRGRCRRNRGRTLG